MKLHNPYSFVIFDWDGTLMDSTGRIVSAMQRSAKNVDLPVPTQSEVKSIIGLSMQAVMDKLFPLADEEGKNALLEEYRFQYIEGDQTPTPLFEGVLEQLEWLKNNDVLIAVATGKARAGLDRVMKEVSLLNYFDFSICADEAQGKPNPEMVLRLLEQTGKKPHEAIVVGDSIHDINMANNAKVDAVAVTSGANEHHELSPLEPVVILDRVTHIRDWLQP